MKMLAHLRQAPRPCQDQSPPCLTCPCKSPYEWQTSIMRGHADQRLIMLKLSVWCSLLDPHTSHMKAMEANVEGTCNKSGF